MRYNRRMPSQLDRKKYTRRGTLLSPRWDEEWIAEVEQMEEDMHRQVCGAKVKSSGLPCRQPPGARTDHPGEGRCAWHGGKSVAPSNGKWSLLRHYDLQSRVVDYFSNDEMMDIRSGVATAWAALDALLEEDAIITPDRAQEIVSTVARISTMVKQHHDITEGQKIKIEVPQFMEWAESMYELAVKYIRLAGGDVSGFLAEAQQYFSGAVAIVTGDSPPALERSGVVEAEVVL